MTSGRTVFFQSCLGVFQGGGCRGAAFAGAVSEATARGVDFAGVAGASAGSIVAALIGAGATAAQLTECLKKLDFSSLLVPPESASSEIQSMKLRIAGWVAGKLLDGASEVLNSHGMYSSRELDRWINVRLKEILPNVEGPRVKCKDLVRPTWIVAADIVDQDVKIWSQEGTPTDDVAYAVRCSCSIPVFFQPVEGRYIDGGTLSNLPAFVFGSEERNAYASRILAFTLINERTGVPPETAKGVLHGIINTIVDGATRVQSRLVQGVHEVRIPTGLVKATDFQAMTPAIVDNLIKQGKDAAGEFFDDELSRVHAARTSSNIYDGHDEVYGILAESFAKSKFERIVFCQDQPNWIYSLYPSLLNLRASGVHVTAYTHVPNSDRHNAYQRRLLHALGITIVDLPTLPFRGVLLDPHHHTKAKGIVYIEDSVSGRPRAVYYESPEDLTAIQSLYHRLPEAASLDGAQIVLSRGSDEDVIRKLRQHVPAYERSQMAMETIAVKNLIALSRLVRGYKFQQISSLFRMFENSELQPFDVGIVSYGSGSQTIVTPPVVEKSGSSFILIQGTTRALYCHRNGLEHIRCLVVSDPSAPLPAELRIPISQVLTAGRSVNTRERYGQDIDKDFRRIEFAVHHPDETLIK